VALPGNKLALAVVTNVAPAHPASFEEAQNQVRDTVMREKLDKLERMVTKEMSEYLDDTCEVVRSYEAPAFPGQLHQREPMQVIKKG